MQKLIGVSLILVSGVSFGAMAIFARLAYEAGTDPVTLVFLRFAIASACMILITLARRIPLPRGRAFWILVLMGSIGYAGQSFCYFTALTFASAGLVALLLYLYPALVTLLATLFLKEPISKLKVSALIVALFGTALTIGPSGGGKPLGIVLSLGAALIYACYILVGSKAAIQGAAILSSTVIITSAAVVYSGLVAVRGLTLPTTLSGWASVAAIALVSTVLAVITFLAGLERVGPTNAATLSTIEPVVTVLLAGPVLGETITPLRVVGGAMILLAVIFLARGEMEGLNVRSRAHQKGQGKEFVEGFNHAESPSGRSSI